MKTCASTALLYRTQGASVIPLRPRQKIPFLDTWSAFQDQPADAHTIRAWWGRWPHANVAIVTGRVSGLVVLDIDGPEGQASLRQCLSRHGLRAFPETPVAKTGKGWHFYFSHPGGVIPNHVGLFPHVDVRGDGGYVVSPPSIHPSGQRYRWVTGRSLADVPLSPLPQWLLDLLHPQPVPRSLFTQGREDWTAITTDYCFEGSRNHTLTRLVGHWLGNPEMDPHIAELAALGWGLVRCQPPLSVAEIQRVYDSIADREIAKARRGAHEHE